MPKPIKNQRASEQGPYVPGAAKASCARSQGRYERLLVLADPHGEPDGLDLEAILRCVPHRKRVGCAIGVRPAGTQRSADWSARVRNVGLDVVEYGAEGGLARARAMSALEFHLRAMRLLCCDHRIDGVLVVCPTFLLAPFAHAVHASGRPLMVADLQEYLGPSSRLVDRVFAIDGFITAGRP